jgi:hypothetical protein
VALLRLALWLGLAAGLVEVALRALQKFAFGQRISLSPQFVWMAPLADAALYTLIGLIVIALLRPWSARVGTGAVTFAGTFLFVAAPLYMFQRLHVIAVVLVALGVAAQSARWAQGHAELLHRIVRRTLVPAAVLVVLLAATVNLKLYVDERRAVAAIPDSAEDAPNIVVVILDTVRAASLRLHGYGRATTPNLDRLAQDAIVFDRAIATAPWTLPSHASLFTGHYPDVLDADWRAPLGADHPTLAEVLAARGYVTGGFSGNVLYATYETGLARGFTRFEDYPMSVGMVIASSFPARIIATRVKSFVGHEGRLVRRSATRINRGFFGWLDDTAARGHPFFAFVNYFDAHDPYLPPAPFDTLFGLAERAPVL